MTGIAKLQGGETRTGPSQSIDSMQDREYPDPSKVAVNDQDGRRSRNVRNSSKPADSSAAAKREYLQRVGKDRIVAMGRKLAFKESV